MAILAMSKVTTTTIEAVGLCESYQRTSRRLVPTITMAQVAQIVRQNRLAFAPATTKSNVLLVESPASRFTRNQIDLPHAAFFSVFGFTPVRLLVDMILRLESSVRLHAADSVFQRTDYDFGAIFLPGWYAVESVR
jgi:hypothetical protein